MLNRIWKWFLQGMALVAPVALTIALLVWLGAWSEKAVGGLIKLVLPADWYFRGLGLLTAIVATLAVGLLANVILVRWLVRLLEAVLERIPLVALLFQAFKDIARFFSRDVDEQLGQVVAVDFGEVRLVGFVMQEDARLPGDFADADTDRIAVYVAMSYQLGGFTVHVPKERVTPLNVPADRALRAVLTGGSLEPHPGGNPEPGAG